MPVCKLKEEMPYREFIDWRLRQQREPFGAAAIDKRFSVISGLLHCILKANLNHSNISLKPEDWSLSNSEAILDKWRREVEGLQPPKPWELSDSEASKHENTFSKMMENHKNG